MTGVADAGARAKALDPARSFIVQAPAGSGKTELLIGRYVALLGAVDKPEEILAITFTKKAAAEMKARVAKALPDPSIAHRIRIMTIDAFCASLTRRMPVVARFGAQPQVVEDAAHLYEEAAARTLASLDDATARLLAHLDNDVAAATGLLATMLQRRDQWRRKTVAPTREELDAILVAERERALARARPHFPDASPELAAELLTKERTWRKRNKRAQQFEGNEPARLALSALLDLPPPAFSDAQWEALGAILELIPAALANLLLVFQARGEVDFTEVTHGALAALGDPEEPTDLLLALDTRIRHILVDEFQDTSFSQWELLERLTAGWEEGDGRTVFAVGDPMQSVYRFRDAEVRLFLRARHEGLPNLRLESLVLSTNFRSQAGVVDWVNGFFPRALPAAEDVATGAVPYAPSVAHHPRLPGDAVRWHGFASRADEAARVVELAGSATGKAAILVRNRSHLDAIVPALKAAGVRFRAVEIEPLGERPVVQDLWALTRAALHLADRVAWLAILRAPWCGLGLAELAEWFEGREEATVWERLQELPALQHIARALEPLVAGRRRGTLRDAVESAWLALGGPACVEDATDLEDAEAYLDELERTEVAGAIPDPAAFAERLATKLFARPDVHAGPDALQIMTIHKAKGLQFDTVIVPGLDRPPRAPDRPLFAWQALGEGKVLLAPIDETGAGKDPIYRYVRDLDREAEDIEAGRLFYVAATRAISRLHLTGCAKLDKDGAMKPPPKRSLLAIGWFEAEAHFDLAPAGAPAAAPAAPREDTLRRLAPGFVLPPAPAPVVWQAPPEGREEAEPIEFSWVGETARHVGTVVHRWLQRIGEDALKGWDPTRVETLRPLFARQLARRGVPPGEIDGAVALVVRSLTNSITDERGRWILGPHPEAKSEYRVRAVVEGGARTYVMDRVFTTTEGVRWLVDFKTSWQQGSGIDVFLDRESARYASKISTYVVVLNCAKAGLYFAALNEWRET